MILKVGAVQMNVCADVEANLRRIESFVIQAAEKKVDMLMFPETALSGYFPQIYPSPEALDIGPEKLARHFACVRDMAAKWEICLAIGTSVFKEDSWYNAAYLVSDCGEVIGEYTKAHLTGGDARFYKAGDALPVFTIRDIPVGLQICYDIRFPEGYRALALKGVKVVFHLANAVGSDTWKVPVIEGHLRSRAAENGIFIVYANAAGPLQMALSQIVNPKGLVLASANMDVEELITSDLDLKEVSRSLLEHRRTDLVEFKMGGRYDAPETGR